MRRALVSLGILLAAVCVDCRRVPADNEFEQLTKGQVVNGFRADAVYTDAASRAVGARFEHQATGFELTLLRIQSVPQAYLWVESHPTSNMGEPHTQEHLLLGKGNKGRYVASLESMSLANSSAYTLQLRTIYHFHTTAGVETFWTLFEERIDALLNPDYSDEEIRREVGHIGITERPDTGELRLEEKGTVYNEMVSTYERPWARMGHEMQILLYGPDHPLSYSAGGLPEAIREMQPSDIREFHSSRYVLGNMGVIVALADDVSMADALDRTAEILNRLDPDAGERSRPALSEADLPAPRPAPAGQTKLVRYPHQNAENPGDMILFWPAVLKLDAGEQLLLELFISAFAGDETTDLYRIFVDSSTRERDLGVTGVFSGIGDDPGRSVYMGLSNISAAELSVETLREIRRRVDEELSVIAAMADESNELEAFNDRVRSRVISRRRSLSKFAGSPPRFGYRSTGSFWMNHLEQLDSSPGFRHSLVLAEEMARIDAMLDSGRNIWTEAIERWGLRDAVPYALAARADAGLAEIDRAARDTRLATELQRLRKRYGADDPRQALQSFKKDYDAETATLDAVAARVDTPEFIDDPPLTLDDSLRYTTSSIGGVPMLHAEFGSLTGATSGLALRLDVLDDAQLLFLAALPALLTEVGIIEDGTPVGYAEMSERLRREILNLEAYYSSNSLTKRAELVIRASGNDPEESRRAIEWMRLVLASPDWRPENLLRLRDLMDRTVSALRNRMRSAEESWVQSPAAAYRLQENRLLLSTESFLTQSHAAHRLRWMLRELPDDANRDAFGAYMERLAPLGGPATRNQLAALATALQGQPLPEGSSLTAELTLTLDALSFVPVPAREAIALAADDLAQLLGDLADSSLAVDWAYLCRQMRADLLRRPSEVLAQLDAARRALLARDNARIFVISSSATRQTLTDDLDGLVATLSDVPVERHSHEAKGLVASRLRGREPAAEAPVFVGLVNPNTQGGVFLNSAPIVTYADADTDGILHYLSGNLYGGGGAHSMFMKTWGAGLAYSNGLGSSPAAGRASYYAERCPELPQTLRFVIGELQRAEVDASLVDYAVAGAFGASRSASSFEARGESMAADLADGLTPEVVRRFRRAVLEIRDRSQLAQELFDRMEPVYGRVLPGYGPPSAEVANGIYFVIGPERQMELFEDYLRTAEGSEARLWRLYPRDFWITTE